MEFKGVISGTGNAETRENEITAEDLGTLRHYIVGRDGVCVKSEYENTADSVTIKKCAMIAYGYGGSTKKEETFYFHPTATTQYHFIYGEINRSIVPNEFKLKVKNNQESGIIKPNTFRQDYLNFFKTGIFQLPLYRVEIDIDGIKSIEDYTQTKPIKKVFTVDQTHKITEVVSPTCTATTHDIRDYSERIATVDFVHLATRDYIDNNGTLLGYNMTIIPRDVGGNITFSPLSVVINTTNPVATFTAYTTGYIIDTYTWSGNFIVTKSDNIFTVDLGDYVPPEDEEWYIDFTTTPFIEIEFTIAGYIYHAVQGMTWGEWLESEYNNSFENYEGYIYSSETGYVVDENNIRVTVEDEIIANNEYFGE